MSKEEDDDKVKMSHCEKKPMVIQGIKDRSEDKGSVAHAPPAMVLWYSFSFSYP